LPHDSRLLKKNLRQRGGGRPVAPPDCRHSLPASCRAMSAVAPTLAQAPQETEGATMPGRGAGRSGDAEGRKRKGAGATPKGGQRAHRPPHGEGGQNGRAVLRRPPPAAPRGAGSRRPCTSGWLSRPSRPFSALPFCRLAGSAPRLVSSPSCLPLCRFAASANPSLGELRLPLRGPLIGDTKMALESWLLLCARGRNLNTEGGVPALFFLSHAESAPECEFRVAVAGSGW